VKADLGNIIAKRKTLESSVGEFDKVFKKSDTVFGKQMMEWKTIYNGLIEGKKEMEEQEKAIDALGKQLATSRNTWKSMLARLQPIKDKMQGTGKDASKAIGDLDNIDKKADALVDELKKAAGDMADLKDENDAIKKLKKNLERVRADFTRLSQDASSVAPDPKL
jgi:chromosome segregation ATPase